MLDHLPNSVRYVKNGKGGQWWKAAKTNAQIHAGWRIIPAELLLKPDYPQIRERIRDHFGTRPGAVQDFNALRDLLDSPSQHVWVTFEDGFLWWCVVGDGVTVNPDGGNPRHANFWLSCKAPWNNRSLQGRLLAMADLPGTVTTTAGFKGTVCTPKDWPAFLRIIQDLKDAEAENVAHTRQEYINAVDKVVRRLSPQDFEQLVDLILAGTGWIRISTLGGTREGIDIEAENPTAAEIAFVQVKSSASQGVLNDYVARFGERRDRYARMIFAVHTPVGLLAVPAGVPEAQLWTGEKVARLVVRLGLGEWVESRLA